MGSSKTYFVSFHTGCIDNDGNFHHAGEEFTRGLCTLCSCELGSGITPTICRAITCDAPPTDSNCIEEAVEGQCCPTIICLGLEGNNILCMLGLLCLYDSKGQENLLFQNTSIN